MLLKALGALAATLLTKGLNSDRKMAGWFDPGPTWPLRPSEVAQSSHPCLAPYNSPRFFPFPFLSFVISAAWPEKSPPMESCQDSSALELELHEYMPKKPNFEFELLKCNKARFSCLFFSPSPFSLCPKPLADVEVFSNVSLLVLSWENGSQHSHSRKPQELFLCTTIPYNSHEQQPGGEKRVP